MNVLIVGASAGLGRALAEVLAAQGYNLFLVSSSEEDLYALSQDLSFTKDVQVSYCVHDLASCDVSVIYTRFFETFSTLELLILNAGYGVSEADMGCEARGLSEKIININFTSHVKLAHLFLPKMYMLPQAALVGIGSVAVIKAKPRNVVYGAAKAGLEYYFKCLMLQSKLKNCKVHFYRMGYLRTSMLGDNRILFPAARPIVMAKKIVMNLRKKNKVRYLPRFWNMVAFFL